MNFNVKPYRSTCFGLLPILLLFLSCSHEPASSPPPENSPFPAAEKIKIEKYPSGAVKAKIPQLNGWNHGVGEYFHENGEKYADIPWREGKKHGKYDLYRPDGTISETLTFSQGIQRGPYRVFNEEGVLIKEGISEKGKDHGLIKYFHPNGNLKQEIENSFGIPNGVSRWYDQRGVLFSEGIYSMGQLNGPYRVFHLNGRVKEEVEFVNGRRHGFVRWFDKEGNQTGSGTYIDGDLQETGSSAKNQVNVNSQSPTYSGNCFLKDEEGQIFLNQTAANEKDCEIDVCLSHGPILARNGKDLDCFYEGKIIKSFEGRYDRNRTTDFTTRQSPHNRHRTRYGLREGQ